MILSKYFKHKSRLQISSKDTTFEWIDSVDIFIIPSVYFRYIIMHNLKKISSPVSNELREFQGKLREAIKSDVSLLDKVMGYIIKNKGKQLRPLLVFLSAKANGQISESSHHAAAVVEILHTATLVHDDVVDEADTRRGAFSVNALWKSKIAILAGDYLLSRGLLLALENKDYEVLHLLSESVKLMAEGELLQLKKSRTLNIKREDYFKIIKGKTASLLAAACASGAASVSDQQHVIARMKSFGHNLGMAFQITDDLLDYGTDDIGKPLGNDIRQQKITLPLIYALEQSHQSESKSMMSVVKNKKSSKTEIENLIEKVRIKGGINHARVVINDFAQKAKESLEPLTNSAAKQSLISLVEFVVNRKK